MGDEDSFDAEDAETETGGDCSEEESAERTGADAADGAGAGSSLGVRSAGFGDWALADDLSALPSSCCAFLFFLSIAIVSPGRIWARAPVTGQSDVNANLD